MIKYVILLESDTDVLLVLGELTTTIIPETSNTHHKKEEVTPTNQTQNPEEEDEGTAGAGLVLAWVLTGLALFLVIVLAMALCNKLTPPANRQTDFLPSVDVISHRKGSFNVSREAGKSPYLL